MYNRKQIHIARRLFHMLNGIIIVLLYSLYFDKKQILALLSFIITLLYIWEEIRLKYNLTYNKNLSFINKILYRKEEDKHVASAMPYIIGCMFVIAIYSKSVAIISILFLALGDAISSIIGIKMGIHYISRNKTAEGTLAFFIVAVIISFLTIIFFQTNIIKIIIFSILSGLIGIIADLTETKLDDNITIPVISGILLSILHSIIF